MARSNIKYGNKATAGSPHPTRSPNRPASISNSTDPSESSLKASLMTGQVAEHPAGTETSPNAPLGGRGGGGGGFVGVPGGEIGGMSIGLSPSDKRDISSESEPASESVSTILKKHIHPEVPDTKSSAKDSNVNVVIRSKGTTNELSTPIVSPTTAAHADALLNTINAITDTSSALLSTTQRLTHAASSNISETSARESVPQKKNINFYDNSAFTSEILSGEGGGMEDLACLPNHPITKEHLPPNWNLEQRVLHPGTPRANAAVSAERPDGSVTGFDPSLTVLQQHVKFWDTNDKGVIYPSDTFNGFRRLGFGYIISAAAVLVIHGTFSYPTQKSFIPNPFFPIYLDRIHRTKHGSDSEVIDTEGRFIPQKFEEIFSKYDKGNKGGLSWSDIQEMVYGSMNVMDFVGWTASRLEWWTTFLLLKDQRGVVSKERIRGLYDGTVFQQVAAEVERRKNLVKED